MSRFYATFSRVPNNVKRYAGRASRRSRLQCMQNKHLFKSCGNVINWYDRFVLQHCNIKEINMVLFLSMCKQRQIFCVCQLSCIFVGVTTRDDVCGLWNKPEKLVHKLFEQTCNCYITIKCTTFSYTYSNILFLYKKFSVHCEKIYTMLLKFWSCFIIMWLQR